MEYWMWPEQPDTTTQTLKWAMDLWTAAHPKQLEPGGGVLVTFRGMIGRNPVYYAAGPDWWLMRLGPNSWTLISHEYAQAHMCEAAA